MSYIISQFLKKYLTRSNRVLNLSKNDKEIEVDKSLLKEKAEYNLYYNYENIVPRVKEYIFNKDYKRVFELLEDLCKPVEEFFEKVLVMTKEANIRRNRIAIIKKISILFNQVADLSKIVSTKEKGE